MERRTELLKGLEPLYCNTPQCGISLAMLYREPIIIPHKMQFFGSDDGHDFPNAEYRCPQCNSNRSFHDRWGRVLDGLGPSFNFELAGVGWIHHPPRKLPPLLRQMTLYCNRPGCVELVDGMRENEGMNVSLQFRPHRLRFAGSLWTRKSPNAEFFCPQCYPEQSGVKQFHDNWGKIKNGLGPRELFCTEAIENRYYFLT